MAADLRFNGFFYRRSLVLLDSQLVVLEHQWTRDRVRRIALDRVTHVLSWKTTPWLRMFFCTFLFGAIGIALLLDGDSVAIVFSAIVLTVLILVLLRYAYMRQTTIRITRAEQQFDFKGVVPPRRATSLLTRLDEHIRQTQYEAEQRILIRQAERARLEE